MKDPSSGKQSENSPLQTVLEISAKPTPEAEQSCAVGGGSEDVEKSQDGEWDNILDVVLVSSPHPLDILV